MIPDFGQFTQVSGGQAEGQDTCYGLGLAPQAARLAMEDALGAAASSGRSPQALVGIFERDSLIYLVTEQKCSLEAGRDGATGGGAPGCGGCYYTKCEPPLYQLR